MKAYKGFNKDMTCRGFQFEEGKEYTEDEAKMCEKGFHACIVPSHCFNYYSAGTSVFHEVEIDDNGERNNNDSKICGKRIKIGAEINPAEMAKRSVKEFFEWFEFDKKIASADSNNAGDYGVANTGDSGAANAGNRGAANAGYRGAANAGYGGAANTGDSGAANAGDRGAANAGNWGAANAGDRGAANAGNWGAAIVRNEGAASVGKQGVAVAYGYAAKAKGNIGAVLVFVGADENWNNTGKFKAVMVDGEKIKANVWYTLKGNELCEATDAKGT